MQLLDGLFYMDYGIVIRVYPLVRSMVRGKCSTVYVLRIIIWLCALLWCIVMNMIRSNVVMGSWVNAAFWPHRLGPHRGI